MENLMNVVKEANKDIAELMKNWKNTNDVDMHFTPFYERVKHQCPNLNFFIAICFADFKKQQQELRSMGGGITKLGEDLTFTIE